MTREEAIKQLTINRPSAYTELREAIDIAIKALKPKPMQKFDNVKQHIDRLAGDYKCWDERLSHEEALELSRMLEQKPCEDAISREKAKEYLYKKINEFDDELYDIFSRIIDDMYNELPSVEQGSKTGHWIAVENEEMETVGYYCSECDLPMETENQTRFCPQCGSYNGGNDNGDE